MSISDCYGRQDPPLDDPGGGTGCGSRRRRQQGRRGTHDDHTVRQPREHVANLRTRASEQGTSREFVW